MAKKPTAEKPAPVIVEAVGTASAGKKGSGKIIEEAMAKAGLAALAEGVTDPDEIRKRKLAAREAAKKAMRS